MQLIIGFVLDLIFGDPYWLFHPVRWIGNLIIKLEKVLLNTKDTVKKQRSKGLVLLIVVSFLAFGIPFLILFILSKIHIMLAASVEAFMIYQIFATKCLDVETKKVYKALKRGDLQAAKLAVSYLVSRDVESMSEEDVIKAAIETMAENLGDGVIAPIIYTIIGGAPLGWYYKSVNTLDSMVGYKNDQYLNYGRASARWDDVLNYIPARVTAIIILIAGKLLRLNLKNGIKMMMRDRHNHASPNSAYPESAAAGLLEIQLGGKASYFGEVSIKQTMGDPCKVIEVEDLYNMSKLLYGTAIVGFMLGIILKYWLGVL